jgi:hypothetical protein
LTITSVLPSSDTSSPVRGTSSDPSPQGGALTDARFLVGEQLLQAGHGLTSARPDHAEDPAHADAQFGILAVEQRQNLVGRRRSHSTQDHRRTHHEGLVTAHEHLD